MRLPLILPLVFSFAMIAGCAPEIVIPKPDPPPPPPPPTQIKTKFEAGADLNPDSQGRPSPVLVRIYQLKADTGFKGADFFDLFKSDKTALAADLVQKEEFLLKPGDARELAFEPKADAQIIGVFAAFRNVDSAQWRAYAPVVPHKINPYSVILGNNKVELTPLPVESPPAPPPAPPEAKPEAEAPK